MESRKPQRESRENVQFSMSTFRWEVGWVVRSDSAILMPARSNAQSVKSVKPRDY